MKSSVKKILGILLLAVALASSPLSEAQAQCAMCSLTADSSVKNGNTQGDNLNKGILFLLAMPYTAVALVGFLWYRKYRKKQEAEAPNPFSQG
ncbi:hypothetical protein [Albibacterium profundi]|uniref:Uncharacterized protein n=1 Tax=Albibacterium profundi TaxID=3134906 RepID=A0ABV5CH26_9SPHI